MQDGNSPIIIANFSLKNKYILTFFCFIWKSEQPYHALPLSLGLSPQSPQSLTILITFPQTSTILKTSLVSMHSYLSCLMSIPISSIVHLSLSYSNFSPRFLSYNFSPPSSSTTPLFPIPSPKSPFLTPPPLTQSCPAPSPS